MHLRVNIIHYVNDSTGTCEDEHFRYACPRCLSFETCPFLRLRENYCVVAKVVNILDHQYIYCYSYFVVLWAPIFIIFWRRREKYWIWMWELFHIKNVTTTRPEFTINYNNPPRSVNTGLWKYYNTGFMKLLRSITTLAFLGICVYIALRLWLDLLNFKYDILLYNIKSEALPQQFEKLIVVGVFTLICMVVMTGFEKVCQILAIFVTRFENHRTSETYEQSMAIKLFILSFVSTFPLMIYYSWYKSRLFYVPGRPYDTTSSKTHSKFYYGYTRNCGPLPCIDEACVALTLIFIFKQSLPKFLLFLKYIFYNTRTDYNQGKSINRRIPCWEREYRLNTITAIDMIKKYNNLAMQIALITWYVPSSPLLPLAALIINLIDVRITARDFLLSRRRPLLHERMGVDIWSNIFTVVSFASISTNAVLLAWSTRVAKRHYYLTLFKDLKNFFEYYISIFITKDFLTMDATNYLFHYYGGHKPQKCYFPGNMPTLEQFNKDHPGFPSLYYFYPKSVPVTEYWFTKVYEDLFLSLFQYSALFLVLLVYFLFPPTFKDVEDSMRTEENIKEAFITHTGS